MRAHRRINATNFTQLICANHLIVQRFAHAMQALKLIVAHIARGGPRVNRRDGVCIVRGKLCINHIGRTQQFLRTGQIRHVGVHFARVHGITIHAIDLRAFDFRIPIRTFDQTHHELSSRTVRQIDQIIQHKWATFLVRLHHEANAIKTSQIRVKCQSFHQIQRQLQAIGFFCIDVQTNVITFCQHQQLLQTRQQFTHDAITLRTRITWMQGRQFHRNTRAIFDATAIRSFTNRVYRRFI